MAEEYDYLFKSIVVGDGGVGKTALTLRFSKGFFTEDYKMTIGVDFHVKTISIDTLEGPIKCKLQLWDTGGQERFSSIRPMYYRGSLGSILVFDLTNSASFEHLPQWIEEVRANIKSDIPVLLIGNKSDLTDQRAVSIEEINNFTRDFNLYYMETSAKTGDGVGDCFYILACLMIGQGVPDQLIDSTTVFAPGQIIIGSEPIEKPEVQPTIPQKALSAPSVPEPVPINTQQKPEPELEYEAPPVPEPKITYPKEPTPSFEPEPELEYEAPPVPEPASVFRPPANPEIFTPEPTDIEFKTPDQIIAEKSQPPEQDSESYKPKTIPFTSNVPIPAPTPKEFQTRKTEKPTESSSIQTPFRVTEREDSPKPRPASMTIEQTPQPQQEIVVEPPFFQDSASQPASSESLVDYMPQTMISKKEMKKLAKEKKKEEKENAKIEKEKKNSNKREKQGELFEAMKTSKKSKKQKKVDGDGEIPEQMSPQVSPSSETSSLFQALTKRTEEIPAESSASLFPFTATKRVDEEEKSKLRIIPNVADIDSNFTSFTAITSSHSVQEEKQKEKKKDLLICEQCGTMLSSDYAYCNKCGNKL